MNKPVIIAEIGCNHKGDMQIAHKMIKLLGTFKLLNENSYIDIVKFQKRTNKELLTPEEYNAPHPNPINSYGNTYGEHREFLEFDLEQNRQLKKWCEEEGLIYSTSTWDLTAAKEIVSFIKENKNVRRSQKSTRLSGKRRHVSDFSPPLYSGRNAEKRHENAGPSCVARCGHPVSLPCCGSGRRSAPGVLEQPADGIRTRQSEESLPDQGLLPD